MLAAPGADAVLIDLLSERRYENWAASTLLRLALPPSREKPWLGNSTNFDAIWAARAGARPPGFDAVRAKRYAEVLTRRIEALKEESADAAKPQNYAGQIKGLAVLIAALDGRDSASLVIDALTPPSEGDGYARMNGMRALLISGAILPFDSMLAVLEPAIRKTLSQGLYNDQSLSLLIDCLELLPFSDDPARAIARIEEAMSRFEYRHYRFRDLVTAMGQIRSEAAVPFLLKLARDKGGLQNMEDTWIEAMGRLDIPSARNALLSFTDPQIPWLGVRIGFNHHSTERYAALIAEWARQDHVLRQRVLNLSEESSITPTQKRLLTTIYRELGGDAVIAGCNLLQGTLSPYGTLSLYSSRERGLETEFLERRPYGRSNYFVLVPRNAERERAELFRTALSDPTRRQAALSILGQV